MYQLPGRSFWYIPSPGYIYNTWNILGTTILQILKILPGRYRVHFYAYIGTHPCIYIFDKAVYDTELNPVY